MVQPILHKLTAFRLLLPYIVGLLLAPVTSIVCWSLLLWAGFFFLLYSYIRRIGPSSWGVRWLPGLGCFFIWTTLGMWSMNHLLQRSAMPETSGELWACVRVVELPVVREKRTTFVGEILSTQAAQATWEGKRIQFSVKRTLLPDAPELGSALLLKLYPKPAETPAYPGAFDYRRWLMYRGICGTAWVGSVTPIALSSTYLLRLKALAECVRGILIRRFQACGLEHQELAFVTALVIGVRSNLESSVVNDFSTTGISHILSVSGLHVAVLYGVLAFLLGLLDPKGRLNTLRQLILIAFLLVYAFVTGLSPSVCRAAFMLSMLALGKSLGKRSLSLNTILFTALVLLLIQPGYLMDLGFQLSYLSVLALILVYPKLVDCWTPSSLVLKHLWELMCLSLAAQLGTAPITIQLFQVFPTYFLMNNLIAVPLSSFILYLAASVLAFGWVPYLGTALSVSLKGVAELFLKLTASAADIPHALITGLHLSRIGVCVLYATLFSFMIWAFWKRRRWIFPFLMVLSAFELVLLLQCFGL